MNRTILIGISLFASHATLALADAKRGDEAFLRGDYVAADHEWRGSAEAGDAAAMLGIGTLYDTGHGVPQDFAQALSWYQRAADAGSASAMFNVGAMYDNGRGTSVNRPEAIKWYSMSAAKGNGRAAYAAATIYRDGDGVPKNIAAAIAFFKIAGETGVNAARFNLASLGQGASHGVVASSSRSPGKASDGTTTAAEHPLAARSRVADAPVRATSGNFAVAAAKVPVAPVRQPDPPAVQVVAPGTMAAGIERFHKIALQRANISPALSQQYEDIVRVVAQRAIEGDDAAQYDAGFAYERGIGIPSDLVKSYVYYIRATLSPDMGLKSAALRDAFKIASRLTEAQQALAADMLTRGVR